MSIKAIELHLIDATKALFGTRLKMVGSLPSEWDAETINRAFNGAPGLYWVFGGASRDPDRQDLVVITKWAATAFTAQPNELARRHGDAREIGAYEIIESIAVKFDQYDVPDVGRMDLVDIDDLFQDAVERKGGSIYGAAFTLRMALPDQATVDDTIADFLRFDGKFDTAPTDGQIDAEDIVSLPQ